MSITLPQYPFTICTKYCNIPSTVCILYGDLYDEFWDRLMLCSPGGERVNVLRRALLLRRVPECQHGDARPRCVQRCRGGDVQVLYKTRVASKCFKLVISVQTRVLLWKNKSRLECFCVLYLISEIAQSIFRIVFPKVMYENKSTLLIEITLENRKLSVGRPNGYVAEDGTMVWAHMFVKQCQSSISVLDILMIIPFIHWCPRYIHDHKEMCSFFSQHHKWSSSRDVHSQNTVLAMGLTVKRRKTCVGKGNFVFNLVFQSHLFQKTHLVYFSLVYKQYKPTKIILNVFFVCPLRFPKCG